VAGLDSKAVGSSPPCPSVEDKRSEIDMGWKPEGKDAHRRFCASFDKELWKEYARQFEGPLQPCAAQKSEIHFGCVAESQLRGKRQGKSCGWHRLGDYGVRRHGVAPSTLEARGVLVKAPGDILLPPADYQKVWDDSSNGGAQYGSFWSLLRLQAILVWAMSWVITGTTTSLRQNLSAV